MTSSETQENPIIVVGNGWAALASVAHLLSSSERPICWVSGTGAHMIPALPSMEVGEGVDVFRQILTGLSIETTPFMDGSYLREFRNKAFREPAWVKAPTPDTRREVQAELLWAPEQRLAPVFETRTHQTLLELEDQLRTKLSEANPRLRKIEGTPVVGFKASDQAVQGLILASGEEILSERIYFADRWTSLVGMQGMPKVIPFLAQREPMAVLQASFAHHAPLAVGVQEGFFASLHKEASEEFERHLWGYFSSDGNSSHWSVCLSSEEVEDNHEIAKKLRRMKSALDKMFTAPSWLPEGSADFAATVKSEQVRFEEGLIFAAGEVPDVTRLPSMEGLFFLTDAYGPTASFRQVGATFEILHSDAETETVNKPSAPSER